MTRPRRRYTPGACQDCGRGPVTTVIFWVSGMRYRVCKAHAREYRRVILKPCPRDCAHCAKAVSA